MKSKFIIIVFSVLSLGLAACGSKSSNNKDTHNPENCTEHDHRTPEQTAPMQESFKVEADSTAVKADTVRNQPHTHSHNGQPHTH